MFVLIKNRGPKSESLDYCDARTQSKVSETLSNAKRCGSHGGNQQITVGRQKINCRKGGERGGKEKKTRGSEGKHYFRVGTSKQTAMKYSRMCPLVLLVQVIWKHDGALGNENDDRR